MYKIEKLPRSLYLGKQGENIVTHIQIDCAAWLEEYPGATMAATMILPNYSGGTVPLPVEMDGAVMTIAVTLSISERPGKGSIVIELRGANGEIKHSDPIETFVSAGHPPASGPMPDPVQDWVNAATAKLAEVDAIHPQTLSFDKSTSVLTISDGNNVTLNRGLTDAQYTHLTTIMARPYGTWTLNTGAVYSQTHPSRDIPGRKSCRVEWGLGIIHLDFVAAAESGEIGYIPDTQPNPGPKAEILIEEQLHDGSTVWIDQGTRAIKAQGLTVGQRYLFNIIGFFVH
jgi:hypothetical protein